MEEEQPYGSNMHKVLSGEREKEKEGSIDLEGLPLELATYIRQQAMLTVETKLAVAQNPGLREVYSRWLSKNRPRLI